MDTIQGTSDPTHYVYCKKVHHDPTEYPSRSEKHKEMAVKASTLEECNIIVLVDKSGSMGEDDMPNKATRWAYVQEYAKGLVKAVSSFDEDGLDIGFFNGSLDAMSGITADNFAAEWNKNSPGGGTKLVAPLKWAFDLHFSRKAAGEARSTLILVFTDGEPKDNKQEIAQTIIDAANRMDRDEEMAVLFIQVGNDPEATKFLTSLDDDLEGLGAKFDIVDRKSTDDIDNMTPNQLVEAAFND